MAGGSGGAECGEAGGGGVRLWSDLSHDILVSILGRLGVADLVAGASLTCLAWRDASRDPSCWRNLDFRDWATISRRLGCRRNPAANFADLLEFCIARSDDFLDSLHFPVFADEANLLYVANRCPELLYFSFENSEISEDRFCEAISKFEFLKGMAIDENLICHKVLLHVRECCVSFSELKVFADTLDEEMASIICHCLPTLQKLEITDCVMSRRAILTFLDNLTELEYLDISGYMNFGITAVVLEKASRLKVFRWDSKFDEGGYGYCSGCGQDHFLDGSCECVFDQKVMEEMAMQHDMP